MSDTRDVKQNRLAASTSPYLRQHATNPVDWYPWGPEALERAKAEDKPILLSVGYSACHWCHVMAHESFESPEIAGLMNESFVNIKVDREERPDVDAIYQKVVALMGKGGGWPLTVFLTPDQRPFYGGTYFPPEDRYGRPGFARVLTALAQMWASKRADAEKQADAFMEGFAQIASSLDESAGRGDLALAEPAALDGAARRLLEKIDRKHGGLGGAPKFPNVPAFELLLAAARQREEAAEAVALTLERMWRGGIYDHLRGGFARYSVDDHWLIPHFEKMLYDNGALLGLYAEASVALPEATAPFARRVVEETAAYLLADMRSDRGSFYSATDADSEGVEGKYFCWTPEQLEEALGPDLAAKLAGAHGVTAQGNFEHGMSVLHRPVEISDELEAELAPARAKLLALRGQRVPPARDEKILTAWNALVISGLCKAAQAAEIWGDARELRDRWEAAAMRACGAILELHRDDQGRLLRASWEGRGHTRAYLEDVALLARACLELHELTLDPRWHEEGEALARELAHYRREGGGMYMSADDGEQLIERTEDTHDSPLPSGVAVAVEVLARLDLAGPAGGAGAPEWARGWIEQTLDRFRAAPERPFAHAALILAARWAGEGAVHVTIRARERERGRELAAAVRAFRGQVGDPIAIAFVPHEAAAEPEALVCRAQACSMPISSVGELIARIDSPALG